MKCKTQEKEEGHTHTYIYIYSYEYKLKYIVKKEGRKRETTKSVYVWHKEKLEHFNVVKMTKCTTLYSNIRTEYFYERIS